MLSFVVTLDDASCLTNGYLETTIDWIPGMNNIRLKDLPSFIRATDPNDILFNFLINESEVAFKASAIVLNTFDALERAAVESLSSNLPPIYTIGPLHFILNQIYDHRLKSIDTNFWKE
ncbi:7-deoxyloganetin glucosyltransferase [Camellia lanceoleosa]|uniref:7-deoxyloganetin glucosyltransferase n=1 Tax=Camellia lanceoleosa TaxID=1840588 RepID=A0ACC0IMS4_9ERIC|nr:7-deoxyloganetin glucosyltransferase [Camellia lanceoleosa]